MENNNLKENIREKVQEKIAVSNIRKEFDMKSKKNSKVIYGILSACAILILCLVVSKNIKYPLNINNNVELARNHNVTQEENNVPEDKIVFNEGDLKVKADYDGKWEDANLQREFDFINEIFIPKELELSRQGKVYVREHNDNKLSDDYTKLQQYSLIYSNGSKEDSSIIEIIFTKEQTILGDCITPKEEKILTSIINGKEVKLFKNKYISDESKIDGYAFFEKNGYKFYINAHTIDEEDFIKVVKSILK